MIYKLSELRDKLKVGDRVKEAGTSFCDELRKGEVGVITAVEDDEFSINDCYHSFILDSAYCLDLFPHIPDWDNFEIGDIVVDKGGNKVKILARLGDVFLPSYDNDFKKCDSWHTISEAKEYGYTFQQSEPVKEITQEEAEKLIGGKFRIK